MIYFVEDDASIRELVTYTLNNTGLPAEGYDRPSAFWTAMGQNKPKLILLDIMLPEEDGMVIIDYKNSYVGSEAGEEELRQRYGKQLALYKEALEASWGRPVKETWLYLFYLKKFIRTDENF